MIKLEWWENYFGKDYNLTAFAKKLHAKAEVDFILQQVKLCSSSVVLDMGCGYGRHAVELAQKGFLVHAVDYSDVLIETAKRGNSYENLIYKVGDMREYVKFEYYDLVVSLFVTVGYFNEEENIQTIKNLCDCVKDNGYLVLEINDPDRLQIDNVEVINLRRGGKVVTERSFDKATKYLKAKRMVNQDNQIREYEMNIRIFTLNELNHICQKNGMRYLQCEQGYGNDKDASTLTVFFRKDKSMGDVDDI